jgi:hypothetical protein
MGVVWKDAPESTTQSVVREGGGGGEGAQRGLEEVPDRGTRRGGK